MCRKGFRRSQSDINARDHAGARIVPTSQFLTAPPDSEAPAPPPQAAVGVPASLITKPLPTGHLMAIDDQGAEEDTVGTIKSSAATRTGRKSFTANIPMARWKNETVIEFIQSMEVDPVAFRENAVQVKKPS